MGKQDKIYELLDEMTKGLNEQRHKLGKRVETGQMSNSERHEQLNQLYVKTLNITAEDITKLRHKCDTKMSFKDDGYFDDRPNGLSDAPAHPIKHPSKTNDGGLDG